jgi:hypothetical protein
VSLLGLQAAQVVDRVIGGIWAAIEQEAALRCSLLRTPRSSIRE